MANDPNIQIITLSGDWTVPEGVTSIDVFCADGGGIETSDFCIGGNAGIITSVSNIAVNQGTTIRIKTGSEGADAANLPDGIAFLENRLKQEADGTEPNAAYEKIMDALQQYRGIISDGNPENGNVKGSPGIVIIHCKEN
ncbi:MAG: hypothetical protein LBL04_05220 [Bacteroidales bacterium]|jgi:hypothetical protein|nr:hypothetical protein [Bacteroidales bacterium]